jgi:hypothetical protein
MGRHSCRPALAHQTGMTGNVSEYSARHGCFCDPQSARKPSNIAHCSLQSSKVDAAMLGIPSILTKAHFWSRVPGHSARDVTVLSGTNGELPTRLLATAA